MAKDNVITSVDSPWIKTAGDENFVKMVLENSNQGPVLVNFWSKKAGPCIRQYPLLDKVIHQLQGKALLVNIDVQRERKVVAELGISSVPTLKLFHHGEVVETAHGYQSEPDLLALLSKHIMRESDKALAQAVKLYKAGQRQRAYELLTETILIDAENARLPITYSKLLMHDQRFAEAARLLDVMPPGQIDRQVEQLRARCDFLLIAAEIPEPENLLTLVEVARSQDTNYLQLQKSLCALAAVNQDYDTAFAAIDAVIDQDREYDEQFARRAALNLKVLLKAENDQIKVSGLNRAKRALAAYVY